MSSQPNYTASFRPLYSFLSVSALLVLILFAGLPLAVSLGFASGSFSIYACLSVVCTTALATYGAVLVFRDMASRSERVSFVILLLFFLVFVSASALVPVISRDALIHHLAVPSLWLQSGWPVELDWHSWSYYPMLIQTIFTGLLPFGEVFCIVFHALFLLLACELVALWYATRKGRTFSTLFPFSLLLLTPVCISLATTPLVDLALVFFCGCVVSCFAFEHFKREHAVFVGIFLAAALSTKYNGLLFAAAFGVTFPYLLYKATSSARLTIEALSTILFVAVIVYSPWLIRNAIYVGNPFHPLFAGIFGVTGEGYSLGGVSPIDKRLYLYGETWLEIIILPIRMLLYGEEGNPRLFDGALTPLFLFGLFAFAVPGKRKEFLIDRFQYRIPLVISTILYFVIALCMGPARVRYLAPLYVVFVMFSVSGLDAVLARCGSSRKIITLAMIAFQVGWALWLSTAAPTLKTAFAISSGSIDASEAAYRHPEYRLIQRINQTVEGDGCTLLLYTSNAFYWFEDCVKSDGYHSASGIIAGIKKAKRPEDVHSYFTQRGIRYLLIHQGRVTRSFKNNLTPGELDRWSRFSEAALQLEFSANGYSFWRIKSLEEIADRKKK